MTTILIILYNVYSNDCTINTKLYNHIVSLLRVSAIFREVLEKEKHNMTNYVIDEQLESYKTDVKTV
jgi:hypothetical protein